MLHIFFQLKLTYDSHKFKIWIFFNHHYAYSFYCVSNLKFWSRFFYKHFWEPQFWKLLRSCTLVILETSQNRFGFFINLVSCSAEKQYQGQHVMWPNFEIDFKQNCRKISLNHSIWKVAKIDPRLDKSSQYLPKKHLKAYCNDQSNIL